MTARHQIRVGGRLGRGRSPIDATPAPTVGEMLLAARERKGVDLHRAERDTKIRAKHLAALESGDYTELPGSVYARGFLRNYAAYLGLDADEILEDWRLEQEATAPRVREPIALPPQPLIEPKGHLRFTRGVLVGALLVLIVASFLGYVGVQLLRFSHPPTLTLDQNANQTLAADAISYTLTGTVDLPAAVITVKSPSGFQETTDANQAGRWEMQVPVTKGRNDFEIRARDPAIPDPDRGSAPVYVILTVPIPATPTPIPQPTGPVPSGGGTPLPLAQIAVAAPLEGAQMVSGPLAVSGTTTSTGVTITATYVGPAGVPAPSPAPSTPSQPGASPTAAPTPAVPGPEPLHLTASAGTFSGSINLAPGRWAILVTADEVPNSLASWSQTVTVDVKANDNLVVTITARGGAAWIRVIVDGKTVQAGKIFRNRDAETYTARNVIVMTTGNAGTTNVVVNGRDLGTLGDLGLVQTWQFEKGKAPRRI